MYTKSDQLVPVDKQQYYWWMKPIKIPIYPVIT